MKMDQDAFDSDITEPSLWKDTVAYENTAIVSKRQTGSRAQTVGDSPYETLKLEDLNTPKVETKIQDNNLKRLKCVIYIMTGLIIVLYITLISLIIIQFVPKQSDLYTLIFKNQVDGHWTDWSSWTACDVTCGNGTHIRTRTCTNPVPTSKGSDCIGESVKSSDCFKDNCLVDGRWAHWSNWSSCDVTCGKGRQLRIRTCTNPMPENKGRDCIGETLQSSKCSRGNCSTFMSAFSVKFPKTYSNINGNYKLTFSSTIYQYGHDFNISTGTYTCSKPGVYHFSATLVKKRSVSMVDLVYCHLYKNNQSLIYIKTDPTDDDTDKGNAAVSQSIVINLNVGDTVYLTRCSNASTSMEKWSSFTGYLLYDNN